MISKVVKTSWTYLDGKMGFCYRVYRPQKESWRKDRIYTYSHHQNLPLTVVDYILNAKNCTTVYIPDEDAYNMRGVKREIYSN